MEYDCQCIFSFQNERCYCQVDTNFNKFKKSLKEKNEFSECILNSNIHFIIFHMIDFSLIVKIDLLNFKEEGKEKTSL